MVVDKLLMRRFGRSWIDNIKSSGITYWFIAALDPWTSQALGSLGVTQCFNAPMDKLGYKGTGTGYQWGSHHWHQTTWNKVYVVKTIFDMGYHVMHSDADTTWFNDPLPWFKLVLNNFDESTPHALFSTDSLETMNDRGDIGTERSTSPYFNINTGVYFVKQHANGQAFFKEWLRWHPKEVGHDQDGLQSVVRGYVHQGDKTLPHPHWDHEKRIIWCATVNKTAVSFLPVHMFGNAYTYINGQVHKHYNSTLYEVHWVWTGGSPECKIANMRDAGRFVDPPEYYGVHTPPDKVVASAKAGPVGDDLQLLTMELDRPPLPEGFNQLRMEQTEEMVQYHLAAGSWQLQQAYFGIMAALALGRTWVLPGYHCFCAKNWYMTQACRINGERHTQFPYMCSLSDLMRAKKVLSGIKITLGAGQERTVYVREWPFLQHPSVPAEVRSSRLVVVPAQAARTEADTAPVTAASGKRVSEDTLEVPWPLNTEELKAVLAPHKARIIHLANATKILGRGFADASHWDAYDRQIVGYKTYWCCRSPDDQKQLNRPNKEDFEMLPPGRRKTSQFGTQGGKAPAATDTAVVPKL